MHSKALLLVSSYLCVLCGEKNQAPIVGDEKTLEVTQQTSERTQQASLPQKWAVTLAVEGDLRFLSHHDMMRAVERLAVRAKLPLRYSQGFNPRPALSLVLPRPVGVASRCDLLAMTLDGPIEPEDLVTRMAKTAPAGMSIRYARILAAGEKPLARSAKYELPLADHQVEPVRQRLAQLQTQPTWPIRRLTGDESPDDPIAGKAMDLRPLVASMTLDDNENILHLTLVPQDQAWARPGEVLRLLGLDERLDLAAMIRTSVDYGIPTPTAPPQDKPRGK